MRPAALACQRAIPPLSLGSPEMMGDTSRSVYQGERNRLLALGETTPNQSKDFPHFSSLINSDPGGRQRPWRLRAWQRFETGIVSARITIELLYPPLSLSLLVHIQTEGTMRPVISGESEMRRRRKEGRKEGGKMG